MCAFGACVNAHKDLHGVYCQCCCQAISADRQRDGERQANQNIVLHCNQISRLKHESCIIIHKHSHSKYTTHSIYAEQTWRAKKTLSLSSKRSPHHHCTTANTFTLSTAKRDGICTQVRIWNMRQIARKRKTLGSETLSPVSARPSVAPQKRASWNVNQNAIIHRHNIFAYACAMCVVYDTSVQRRMHEMRTYCPSYE